jgi:hypothetical protein
VGAAEDVDVDAGAEGMDKVEIGRRRAWATRLPFEGKGKEMEEEGYEISSRVLLFRARPHR